MKKTWQLQEAKKRLSEVLREARADPQIITLHRKQEAVVLSYAAYQRMTGKRSRKTPLDLLEGLPPEFADLELERGQDSGRQVEI